MNTFWAVIAATILVLIIYGIIASKIETRRKRKAREKALPFVAETIRAGQRYDVQMSDGRRFDNVEVLGTNDPQEGHFPIGGWDGLLVLRLDNGKRAYVRQTAVRYVIEV
jgi:hypothetical protein